MTNDRVGDSLSEVEAALLARWPESRIAPDLSRMAAVSRYLAEPQLAYPVVHVAGTNGKTSVSRMIEALLRSFGLQTGLFTSPHLHDMTERVQVNAVPLTPDGFVGAYEDIGPALRLVDDESTAAGGPAMSFFEAVTALAFAAFADAPVDVAVIETGLGGRWDATNIVMPVVSVITPIGLDHQDYLGDTIAAIAGEKAGIIKAGVPVVIARQDQSALTVLGDRALLTGSDLAIEDRDFGVVRRSGAVGGQLLELQGIAGRYEEIFLPLYGAHQAHNAALALAAVETFFGALGQILDVEAVRDGLAAVTSPGRAEVVRGAPTVVVDAAHNPHGARALVATITEDFAFTYLVGVLAILTGKDVAGILEELETFFAEVVITSNSSSRCVPAEEMYELAVDRFGSDRVHLVGTLPAALEYAIAIADKASTESLGGAGVVVTGSVVTAADARAILRRPSAEDY